MKFEDYSILIQCFLGISLILIIFFPIHIPHNIARFFVSTLGISTILTIAVLLFLMKQPLTTLLFVLLAFIILCCSYVSKKINHGRFNKVQYTPVNRNSEPQENNHAPTITLEEQIILRMAPIEKIHNNRYIQSSFKPTYSKLNSASHI